MDDFKIFNTKSFYIIFIKPNVIDHLDWNNPDYVQSITSMSFVKTVLVEPSKIFDHIYELLEIDDKSTLRHVITEPIAEEHDSTYEMIFIDTLNKKHNLEINQLASLLNITGETINGNAIVIKNYIPTLSDEMLMDDMTVSELNKIIRKRGFIRLVCWENDEWREEEMYGDMEKYANIFFEEEKYDKLELAFLKHNINIWYLKSEYGTLNVCGKLLDVSIEKCFIFTMITDTIKGDITKDEVKKIIELSKILTPPFKPDNKWLEDENDIHGRKIIKNKYRVLDNTYKNNF
jgi:hypothetical protein